MLFWKRQFPLFIAFVMGVVFIFQYYIPHPYSEGMLTEVSEWLRIISGFAIILGIASLSHLHYKKIQRKEPGWGYSYVVYLSMIITVVVGLWSGGKEEGSGLGWIYNYTLVPLQGTMFSILAFFVASAAYRAFRAKTKEATVLLIAGTIVMFGRVPLGEYLVSNIGGLAEWILNVPNTAARRAILIGISLGVIATSLKIIFGIERGYLGGKE
ncbi:MAG TPA: hypothetical protein VJM77_07300 [Nitrospiria bacterium]|nr:hypothetical protein [Nitrospiria bacterium]